MDTISAIKNRRSVRKYKDEPISNDKIRELLRLSALAPSGKNRQPWNFVVLQGSPKQECLDILHNKALDIKKQGEDTGSCLSSVRTMRQAPVLILILNPYSDTSREQLDTHQLSVDTQSLGAAIENMLLAATDMGLGSLWVCDIFYAEEEIMSWLERDDELVAAVAVGYAAEQPDTPERKDLQNIVSWQGKEDSLNEV